MSVTRAALAATLLATTACRDAATAPVAPSPASAPVALATTQTVDSTILRVLRSGGIFAEGTYMACLHSYHGTGVPLREIVRLCAVQLDSANALGWGPSGKPFAVPSKAPAGFDAGSVTAVCGSADPRLSGEPVQKAHMIYNGAGRVFDVGNYSWGGKGVEPAPGYEYLGLSEKESEDKKLEAARDVVTKYEDLQSAKADLKKNPKDPALQQAVKDAEKAYLEAKAKAEKDPNLAKKEAPKVTTTSDPGRSETTEGSLCTSVLQVARELLAECHRTGWKSTECQQLHAQINGCPDPTLIYVDPDAGYACAPKVDPQLVIDAWSTQCERNVTPGPDGTSPCSKPVPSEGGGTVAAEQSDMCVSPIALTDPESNGCFEPYLLDDFGRPDIKGLILWGQGVFGGPIVVLPLTAPPVVVPRV